MKKALLFLLLIAPLFGTASTGDTTVVQVHNKTFINWYGPFYKWGEFPSAGKSYHKVILNYTLQCPTGGCSDYDYTQKIFIRKKGSANNAPVNIEIGRLINAFGAGISQSWIRTYRYDVTDYAYLLTDSVEIGTNFEGYPQNNQGWLMTMTFQLIEGTPVREAYKVENVWNGYFPYGTKVGTTDTIELYLTPKKIAIDSNANRTILRIRPTGHGGGGIENCAEFCRKYYYLLVNNSNVASNAIWRDDCGLNSVYPGSGAQASGTWLYDRANWCPGDVVRDYEHDLTSYGNQGDSITIDLNMDNGWKGDYTGYSYEAQLISYKTPSFTNDAALEDIISPNVAGEYVRVNPLCGRPEVIIKNTGTANLTSLNIEYSVEGSGVWSTYQWSGNLAFLDTAHVLLNAIDLSSAAAQKYFIARVSLPNGVADEYAYNNEVKTNYKTTPVYSEDFIVNIRTNGNAENYCRIFDLSGNMVYENYLDLASTTYSDTIHLPEGCYKFVLDDFGKDGLAWPFGTSGSGYARFKKLNETNKYWITFPANFGTSVIHYFTTSASATGIAKANNELNVTVYPNPSAGEFTIDDLEVSSTDKKIRVYNLEGKVIKEEVIGKNKSQHPLNMSNYAPGIYSLELHSDGKIFHQKLTVTP